MSQAVMEPDFKESTAAPQPPGNGEIVPRKKTLLIWGGVSALALLLVFGVRYLVWSAHHEETDDAYLAGHLHPISARVTDTVKQILIDDNQHVVEGQTLIILDPNDYEVRLDQAMAALTAADRQADTAEAAIRSTSQSATAQTTQAEGTIGEAHLDSDFAGPQFYIPLIIRALGQPLIMVPLSAFTTAGMTQGRERGSASALFNMMRNIGGSIGIAGLSTLLSVRERFHSERIGESVTAYSIAVQQRMQHSATFLVSQGSDPYSANTRAIRAMGGAVRRQAFFLVYSDCFLVLGCVLLSSAIALFFMKKVKFSGAVGGH